MIILYLEYEYEFEYERLNKETLLSLGFCTRLYLLFYYIPPGGENLKGKLELHSNMASYTCAAY